ncbi:CW-type domain-containing protein [Abeliophyllum distichum]|uniref:CW-type domain-containing protein n=2 Tax=Abeliophyllum distichum TaxID=126358 RepID=A0ABD1VBC2_9LAMI
MEGWGSVPGMIQDPELEEGETCYHKDDTSIDPDVALSYLDDKVQSILGHFQKDFEGGVSAENLGAKFGGYGSFLPTYQRSPSVWSQPKSPLRVQKPCTPRSPNYLPTEGIPHHSGVLPNAAFSHRNGASAPPAVHPLQNLKAPSGDGSVRQDALLSDQVAESCPIKPGFPSSKSDNQTDQRKLKVRIKVGSDRTTQKNVAIYSGLGLISPSSSAGNSLEESGGIPCEPHEIPDESPTRILQLMTSFPVSGVLLSPLHEDLLNLVRERKSSVDSEHAAALKGMHNHSAVVVDDTNPRLGDGDVLRGKKTKSVEKREKFEKSKTESGMDIKEDKKNLGTETLEYRLQSSNDLSCTPLSDSVCGAGEPLKGVVRAPETIREFEKDVQVRKREGNKDRVKGRVGSTDVVKADSFESISGQSGGKYDYREPKNRSVEKVGKHRVRSSQKDGSVDRGDGARSRGKKTPASFKAYSDNSEDETVSKGAMDPLSQKRGLKSTSGEQDELRTSPSINKLSLQGKKKSKGSKSSVKLDSNLAEESLRSGVSSVTKNKLTAKKDSHKVHSSHKDVVDTRSEHLDILKQSLERPSDDRSKNYNLATVKEKHASADKSKERATSKKLNNQVNSGTNLKEAPAHALPPAKGLISETEQTTVAPVLIQEHWVACDRCQKWRLLPIGTVPQHLPDKWVCSMLNWLPGLNRCDVSEDETTKALYALYQVPFPENQSNLQTHADKITNGVASSGGHCFSQNHQNFDSDRIVDEGKKKNKFKETPHTDGISDPIPSSNFNKNFQLQPVKNISLKEVNQPQAAPNLINKSNMQYRNKSSVVMAKSLNERKDEHLVGDDANPRKKSKRESDQHANVKKIRPEGAMDLDDYQTSGGDFGRFGHGSYSGLPNKVALKEKKKQRELPDNGSLDMNTCNKREISSKKRKLKDSQGSQGNLPTLLSNGSGLQNSEVSVKEESSNSGFHREKKPRVSQIDVKEFSKSKDNNIPKSKSTANRILLSGNRENPIDRSIEKERQVRKYRAKLPLQLTMDDIESLRKDLGSEPLSMAATSSSSKVSDSRKTRGNCKEVKGSPEESVSSSPMRMSHLNKVLPARMETTEKVESMLNDFPQMGSPRKSMDRNGNSESNRLGTARKGKATSGCLSESFEHPVLDFRDSDARDKFSGKSGSGTNPRSEYGNVTFVGNDGDIVEQHILGPTSMCVSECSHSKERMDKNHSNIVLPQQISLLPMDKDRTSSVNFERVAERVSSPQIDQEVLDPNKNLKEEAVIDHNCRGDKQDTLPPGKSVPGSLKGSCTDLRPFDTSVVGDFSKVSEKPANTRHQHGTNNFNGHNVADEDVTRNTSAVSLPNKNSSGLTATNVLKEAENLRDYADRLKDSGFPFESNDAYFEAALKFLHGASLLELCNSETSKHGEMNQMQMYSSTAKLCETCAHEYEKRQEMAAAALAYKCMEVAYMRVVYCKNLSTHRFLHDLQASLPSALQGESPSSSASDLDNLNNLIVDKAVLSKGNGSQAGNHVIVPRNRPNLVRLLDITKDVSSAMEASRKSQNAFAAANVIPEDAQNKEGIASVKRVIDFSFQNVEELVRLVRLAFKAVNRQGFNGDRE